MCRACREGVVAVAPSAIAEQLAGSLGYRPRWAFPVSEGALLEGQLCSRSGLEHPVGIVHGLSDSSPSDFGCGAAANPAKLMSEGSELMPSTRDCGVDFVSVVSKNGHDRTIN